MKEYGRKLIVAFALMTLVPVLSLVYLICAYALPHLLSKGNMLIILAIDFVIASGGYWILATEVRKRTAQLAETNRMLDAKLSDLEESDKALKESERRFRNLFETSADGIALTDTKGRVVEHNKAFAVLVGNSNGNRLIGRLFAEFVPDRYRIAYAEMRKDHTPDDDSSGEVEMEYIRTDGSAISVSTRMWNRVDADGHPGGTYIIARDISDRKRAENRIRRLNEAFLGFGANHVENISSLVTVCGELMNAACALYNRVDGPLLSTMAQWHAPPDLPESDKAEGHLCFDVIRRAGDEVMVVRDLPSSRYAATDPNVARYGLKTYLGKAVKCSETCVGSLCVVYADDYRPTREELTLLGILAAAVSVEEERRLAQRALEDTNQQLEMALEKLEQTQDQMIKGERLNALTRMASGIAHEFNNILMPLVGFSDLMLNDPEALDDKKEVRNMLSAMYNAAEEGRGIVKRLREFYKPEEDEEFEEIELEDMLDDALKLTRPRWQEEARAAGIEVVVQKNLGQTPKLFCNRYKMREVLINLILNALDAMPKGGRMSFGSSVANNRIRLTISDTGHGMSEDVLKRCMEPFFSTKGKRGTGMGLASVYGTISRHGGKLDITSVPEMGTTVTLDLPVHVRTAEEGGMKPVLPIGRVLKVLVVDDEKWARDLLAKYLKFDRHTVDTSENGKSAMEQLASRKYDLVITDRAMPEMNGDQVARCVKESDPATRVILLTGFGDIMKDQGESPAGVDHILAKPTTLSDLRNAIEQAMASEPRGSGNSGHAKTLQREEDPKESC